MNSYLRIGLFLAALLPLLGVLPSEAAAQATGVIRGRIIEAESRSPLGGVAVSIAGTQRGTVTSRDGTFLIPGVPAGQREVRAQSLGFASASRIVSVVSGETLQVDIEMRQAVIDMEEIIITGVAGEATRAKVPFTVDRLTTAALPVPATNAANMIAGKVAGAQVSSSTGRPGAAPSILLRGPTSINASGRSQEPLYIVDGVILSASVADIDAMDIESIEIVKGASAASMYGSRAANGVIQITTARGRNVANDAVRYTVRSEFGRSELPGRFNLTDKHQFAMQGSQFVDGNGKPCDWLACPSIALAGQRRQAGESASAWNTIQQESWPGVTYDHVDRFFEGGDFMTNSISAAGRSGATNYLISYNRQDDDGIMPYHKGSLRHNFRINVDQSVHSNITINATALYSRSRNGTGEGSMFQLTRMPAGVDLLQEDPFLPGTGQIVLKPDPFNDNINPLATMQTLQSVQERGRYLGSLNARWSPLDWFDVDGNMSFDRADLNSQTFRPKGFRNLQGTPQGGSLSRTAQRIEGINASIQGSARRRFGDLALTSVVRYLAEKDDSRVTTTSGSEFTAEGVWEFSNIPNDQISAGSSYTPTRADGFFVITNFDFRDRYIFDALIRQDGSSRFGPDSRRSWYYRLAGKYLIGQEPWFNLPGVSDLSFSYSIGTAGNTPSFSAQYETYSVSGGTITPVALGNRNLRPEFATEQEFRMETMLFDRAAFDLTYATSTVEDQILNVPSLAYTGFSSQWRNAGTLDSNTIEATLNATLLRSRDFSWNARLLFDRTRQEITELDVPAYQTGVTGQGLGNVFYVRPGEAIGSFYGFQFAEKCGHLPQGVDCSQFQVNDNGYLVWVGGAGSWQNGWQTYTDASGATRNWWGTVAPITIRGAELRWGTPFQAEGIDALTGETTTFLPLGTTTPKYSLGFANTVTWRNFSAYGLLQSVQGFSIYNQPLQWAVFQSYAGIMDQSGVPEAQRKPTGYYDRLYGASGLQPSSAFVDDGSYIKLSEVTLRYRADAGLLNRIPFTRGFDGMTFSLTGRNLFTWTDYDGYDPDVGSTGGGTGSAALARVDGYSYPPFRTLTFGVELNF